MALSECNLFRITGTSNCVVYFDNCITCEEESIDIYDGSIWYVSHCTGSTSSPTVYGGTIELITTSPITNSFETCFNNDPVPSGYTIHCSQGQFLDANAALTAYFSGISSYGGSVAGHPCSIQGCLAIVSTGTTDDSGFYSAYWYDNVNIYDVCPQCSAARTGIDPLWNFVSGCCYDSFCLNTQYLPYSGYDGSYLSAGTYDGYSYFTGGSSPGFIYFSTGDSKWCLSSSLGGSCDLFGSMYCESTCPDICNDVFNGSICPTPTPTPTINCSLNDFTALFDCEIIPSPTPTSTSSPTPTPTVTQTPTVNPCSLVDVNFVVNSTTPQPSSTPPPTPTVTDVIRNCIITGDTVFGMLYGNITCPGELLLFVSCIDKTVYTTFEISFTGGTYTTGDTFWAIIDNSYNDCITFSGSVSGGTPENTIFLNSLVAGGCSNCSAVIPSPTPTRTPTMTPSMTPTVTPTPNPTQPPALITYRIYELCGKESSGALVRRFYVQTDLVNNVLVGEYFKWAQYPPIVNPQILQYDCYQFINVITGTLVVVSAYISTYMLANYPTYSPIILNYTGNYFTDSGIFQFGYPVTTVYPTCLDCQENETATIYVYVRCGTTGSGYSGYKAVAQYVPAEYPSGIQITTIGETFKDQNSVIWFLFEITQGILYDGQQGALSHIPTSPLAGTSSNIPIFNFAPHPDINYWDGQFITGPVGSGFCL